MLYVSEEMYGEGDDGVSYPCEVMQVSIYAISIFEMCDLIEMHSAHRFYLWLISNAAH